MSIDWFAPVLLEGTHVRLEPLTTDHVEQLAASCADAEVLRWVIPSATPDRDGMQSFVSAALVERTRGTRVPFAQVLTADGSAIGSTSYLDVAPEHGRIEIGATFLARSHWRTAVNTEAKLLLLSHAFETLGCERVALKTDVANIRSQRAIERLGGVREGVLRHHLRRPDGTWRDTVYYSILRSEWPQVRRELGSRASRP